MKKLNKTVLFFVVLLSALICFEVFNFDTTRYSLTYFFGNQSFIGMQWAVWLAVAACAADFVGMIRMFTDETAFKNEPMYVWIATGVWILAATINATFTWWATTLILVEANVGNEVLSRGALVAVFPMLLALFVWLLRIGLVATLASLGDGLLHRTPMRNSTIVTKPMSRPVTAPVRMPVPTFSPNGHKKPATMNFGISDIEK